MFNDKMFELVKRGAYNCLRGKLLRSRLGGSHPAEGQARELCGRRVIPATGTSRSSWRMMINQGMTLHMSGTYLSAQGRYAAGTLEILHRIDEYSGRNGRH
jgi:formate dehydrogenase